jgi:hypothetical protein
MRSTHITPLATLAVLLATLAPASAHATNGLTHTGTLPCKAHACSHAPLATVNATTRPRHRSRPNCTNQPQCSLQGGRRHHYRHLTTHTPRPYAFSGLGHEGSGLAAAGLRTLAQAPPTNAFTGLGHEGSGVAAAGVRTLAQAPQTNAFTGLGHEGSGLGDARRSPSSTSDPTIASDAAWVRNHSPEHRIVLEYRALPPNGHALAPEYRYRSAYYRVLNLRLTHHARPHAFRVPTRDYRPLGVPHPARQGTRPSRTHSRRQHTSNWRTSGGIGGHHI